MLAGVRPHASHVVLLVTGRLAGAGGELVNRGIYFVPNPRYPRLLTCKYLPTYFGIWEVPA